MYARRASSHPALNRGYHRGVAFRGFDPDALAFFAELRQNNTKEWWAAHRARFDAHVAAPLEELAAALADEFGDLKIFRPYRDVRFSADKSPYKLQIGMVTRSRVAHYLQLSEEGMLTGGGVYDVPAPALTRFRELVDDDASGGRLQQLLDDLAARGFTLMSADALRTAPRGYATDHPRIELLRLRRLAVGRHDVPEEWMWTPVALDEVRDRWRAVSTWRDWLDEKLGDELPES